MDSLHELCDDLNLFTGALKVAKEALVSTRQGRFQKGERHERGVLCEPRTREPGFNRTPRDQRGPG